MDVEHRLGIVLSGGGAKGAAHAGVLKALEERNIRPDVVSGTSAGAIVGALYCAGVTSDEILDVFAKTSVFRPSYYTWKKPGLLNMAAFTKFLEPFFPEDTFESLKIPCYITATDITNAKQKVFSRGPLISRILASACFPIVFAPLEIENKLYADGGILNNFPTEPIQQKCKYLIGVNIQHIDPVPKEDLKSTFIVAQRIYSISTRFASVSKYQYCDVVIAPPRLNQFSTFDMYKIEKMYKIGYEDACEQLDKFDFS